MCGVAPEAALGRPDPEAAQGVDDQLLEPVDVGRPCAGAVVHVHHRVDDQLARPVVGDVAAAVGPHQLGADRRRCRQHVGRVGPHAQGVDVGVLEDEQIVVVRPLGQRSLDRPRLGVGDPSQPADP